MSPLTGALDLSWLSLTAAAPNAPGSPLASRSLISRKSFAPCAFASAPVSRMWLMRMRSGLT